jgi:hypothetical protein
MRLQPPLCFGTRPSGKIYVQFLAAIQTRCRAKSASCLLVMIFGSSMGWMV